MTTVRFLCLLYIEKFAYEIRIAYMRAIHELVCKSVYVSGVCMSRSMVYFELGIAFYFGKG